MNAPKLSRREALARTGLLVGTAAIAAKPGVAVAACDSAGQPPRSAFRYCLNTATIRGQKLGIVKEIGVAAEAGYEGIEVWVDALGNYVKDGGSLPDLKKRISDCGLTVEDAIGFTEWIVEDEARRARGLERAKREMDMVAQIGGRRFAAPPAGRYGFAQAGLAESGGAIPGLARSRRAARCGARARGLGVLEEPGPP